MDTENKLVEAVIALRYANDKRAQYRLTRDPEGWWLVSIDTGCGEFTREFRSRLDVQNKLLELVKNALKALEEPIDRLG